MKQKDINTLLKKLKKRVANYLELNFTKRFPNNNVYINDILYIQNGKRVYFNDISDNELIISFFLYLYSNEAVAVLYRFTMNKSLQVEYICNNKTTVYNIPMYTEYWNEK